MIQLAVECLRFGALGVRSAPYGVFEIVQLAGGNTGMAIARIEVDKAATPALKITRLQPQERSLNTWAMAAVEKAVLENWRDENPTDFKLTAARKEDGVEIILSGHCGYRLFLWRA